MGKRKARWIMSVTAPPPAKKPLSPTERKRMIRERCERSAMWRTIHALGSLKLALVLLATIAIACAVATFYEAEFSATIAQHYIYKNPLFLIWLSVLCVNLFAVTLTRWPWQKKHTGFIITHYGIIILLIGAAVGSRMGFEGNVTLRKGEGFTNRVTTSQSVIQLEDPNSHALFIMPFDASVTKPSERRPRRFPVPGTEWKVVATDFAERLVNRPVLLESTDGSPSAVLGFSSATAARTEHVSLSLADSPEGSLFGMARILLVDALPEFQSETRQETRMVFAAAEPVREGTPSQVEIRILPETRHLELSVPEGARATYALGDVVGKEIPFGSSTVAVREFWPDFEMVEDRPATRSEEWNNPAVLVQIREAVALPGEGATLPDGLESGLWLLAEQIPDGIRYQLWRNGAPQASGEAALGEQFATGWNDWIARVDAVSASARIGEEAIPAPPDSLEAADGFPGFLAHLETGDGLAGEPRWVESGRVTTLAVDHRFVRIAYGLQLQTLPFTLRLVDFDVPRFQGTTTPSNFIATVEFRYPETGERRQDTARMNKPASWPGGFLPLLTGNNYKFSQAEWNPDDLDETTLQVLHDPGWLLKWIGSLAICVGIGILFYWRPGSKKSETLPS